MDYPSSSISAIQAAHLKLSPKLSFFSCKTGATILLSAYIDFRISDLEGQKLISLWEWVKKSNPICLLEGKMLTSQGCLDTAK